jgi:septal ring factor EnvC (AmiA/AmiB activator)
MIKQLTLLILFTAFSSYSFAQDATSQTATQEPQTIDEQFATIIKTSNSFEDYKVIKKYKINQLKDNTQKHIVDLNNQIVNLNKKIETQGKEIAQLKTSLGNTEATLEDTNKEKDAMNFFGAQMSKSGYNTMVWSIAGILLLGLLFFIFKFKNSNILTKQAQKKLDEIEQDFEDYKRKALEKEQKLGRQLQDERNKLAKSVKS